MTVKITGTLTTLSPLTIGAPSDGKKIGLNGKRDAKGFPLTPCSKLAIAPLDDVEELDAVREVPVVNANTLRGLLRRAGATHIERALMARGEKLSLLAYTALRSGSPFGNPDKATPTIDDIQAAMRMPPLAVFGGGPRMIRGSVRVDTGFPATVALRERGLVDPHIPTVDGKKLTGVLWRKRTDDAGNFVDPANASAVIHNYAAAIDAWQVIVASDQSSDEIEDVPPGAEKKASKGTLSEASKLRGINSLTAFECVVPGVPFAFRAELDTDYPASVGYFLLALETFANQQRLGGNWRLGFGRFALALTLEADGQRAPVFERHDDAYALAVKHPLIGGYVSAAQDWLTQVTAGELEAMMRYSDKSIDDHRKKIGKAGAEALAAYDATMAHA